MAVVDLKNEDTTGIILGLVALANQPAVQQSPGVPSSSQIASFSGYAGVPNGVTVTGTGFTYDATGKLVGGTITSIDVAYSSSEGGNGGSGSVNYSGLSEAVSSADFLATLANPTALLLLGANQITDDAPQATGFAGNDLFTVQDDFSSAVLRQESINGGGGVNAAAFGAFHAQTTVSGVGGGSETVVLPGSSSGSSVQSPLTVNLLAVDTLKFIDGSVYEDGASLGAQASLEFLGILGRMPDAINAGGYGALAEQSGTAASASAILNTPEGQQDTANLSNADYVARLYQNILGHAPDANGAAVYQADLDNGTYTRGVVANQIAASSAAQAANASTFASGSVFAADPGAVDVLRAYEVLLNRLPDQSSLAVNTGLLDTSGISLQAFYGEIQNSPEFAATQGSNPYGVTTASSYGTIFAITHSDALSATNMHLIASNGGVPFAGT